MKPVLFNKPYMTGKELQYIENAYEIGMLAGDGEFTEKCHRWLEKNTGCQRALLTHSCTAALEMTALILDIQPGDEIIMPSFTFVSTANAFALRGAIPIFVDIRCDTLNIDEALIESAISPRTKAIVAVHYAGVACEMDKIMAIAHKHNLMVIEDAAQGIMAKYKGKALGTLGHYGTYSFHETKNIIAGEGGALLINKEKDVIAAEIIREKGTNRSQFFRGEVDKYTWQMIGSSFLPGELIAAFLWAQLEEAQRITERRLSAWAYYQDRLAPLEAMGLIRRPIIPEYCSHNAHIYYIIVNHSRDKIISLLKEQKINTVFHYVPLHNSPAGHNFANVTGSISNTEYLSERLIRLPLWIGITKNQQDYVCDTLKSIIQKMDF